MHRIMFVCHGNICRSTMAEFVMKDLVKRAGREADFVISSSATSREEIGNDTHPGTKRALLAHDVPFSPRAAAQLRAADYDGFDLFVGMDSANIRNMRHMLGGDPLSKVRKLLEFSEGVATDDASDVADPWYTGDFETTYDDVLRGCEALLAFLK